MDKEYIRKQLKDYSKYLNMREICRQAEVDSSNFNVFKAGENKRLSDEKLGKIVSIINSIRIEEDVPVTGTDEGEENES